MIATERPSEGRCEPERAGRLGARPSAAGDSEDRSAERSGRRSSRSITPTEVEARRHRPVASAAPRAHASCALALAVIVCAAVDRAAARPIAIAASAVALDGDRTGANSAAEAAGAAAEEGAAARTGLDSDGLGALAPVASASRGVVGFHVIEHAGVPIRAIPDQGLFAPVIVRVLEVPTPTGAAPRYRIEFIGSVVGNFDLVPLLEHIDGTPAHALGRLPIRVDSELPALHGTDLFLQDRSIAPLRSGYRAWMIALALAWLAVPAVVVARRALRRPQPTVIEPPPPPPTVADRLRPLVEAAIDGTLDLAGQARLELLLVRFWSDRLGLESLAPAAAIIRLRRDPEAGALLRAVEGWLHAPRAARGGPSDRDAIEPAASERRPDAELARLLRPYTLIAAETLDGIDRSDHRRSSSLAEPTAAAAASDRRVAGEGGVA
ncbi:MAG TPA: hypothetical protein PKC43_02760 [Phycisphaerales bacterium]|nr:hypothetical protein [Phycisphaerales bacterium]HMP36347.1 hypothetical protein [Phycisphaerales bacterium]